MRCAIVVQLGTFLRRQNEKKKTGRSLRYRLPGCFCSAGCVMQLLTGTLYVVRTKKDGRTLTTLTQVYSPNPRMPLRGENHGGLLKGGYAHQYPTKHQRVNPASSMYYTRVRYSIYIGKPS